MLQDKVSQEKVSQKKGLPVSASEARALFAGLACVPAVVIAVSGGPDSTALLLLAARWRAARKHGPQLIAVTVDHGLRPQSAAEARAVEHLARRLGVRHRTLRWEGPKPRTGLQQAARAARYRLLAQAAVAAKARHILTAHTLDDQAETVLIRMMRGSGVSGLAAMARERPLDSRLGEVRLVRPLLHIPKARLLATLERAGLAFADDPSNRDPRFTRARLRGLMPELAAEGLDAPRLALLASRVRRAEATVELAVDVAASAVLHRAASSGRAIVFDAEKFAGLPDEVALRLLGRAVGHMGDEGPVELRKLEALYETFANAQRPGPRDSKRKAASLRRTLAGAMITLANDRLMVERAPARARRPRTRP